MSQGTKRTASEAEITNEEQTSSKSITRVGYKKFLKFLFETTDFKKNLVTVNSEKEQKCDATKLKPTDIIYKEITSKNIICTTMEKIIPAGYEHDLNDISNNYWTPHQYNEIKKTQTYNITRIINEVISHKYICNIEFFEEADNGEIMRLMKEGSKLIEESGESDFWKKEMYKKLLNRINLGKYKVKSGFLKKQYITTQGFGNLTPSSKEMLMLIDANQLVNGEKMFIFVDEAKIKALTFNLTRYEVE
jgi:hypothetical protein